MLAFTEATDTPNIHVFDNAAFSDDEEEDKEEMATVNVSWGSPRPSFFDSMESDSGKENRSPDAFSSVAYSWRPQKPLKPQSGTTVEKPLKSILKNGVSSAAKNTSESDRISAGIEDIENQIRRLTGKLAELRLQQAAAAEAEGQAQGKQHAECEKNKGEKEKKREVEVMVGDSCNLQTAACVKQPVRRGRIVAAKFMTGVASLHKKMVELQEPPTRFQQDRRKSCFTRLPLEEQKEMRKVSRSLSLSPRKPAPRIFKISGFPTVGAKVPVRKADVTTLAKPKALFPDNVAGSGRRDYSGKVPDQPIASLQSRRKSCYYKLPKESVEKAKGPRSSSLSPKKPRPSISKTPGFLTVGSKKPVKRDGVINLTQPKTLFQGEEAGGGRKPVAGNMKSSRVVGSRYVKTSTVSKKGVAACGSQTNLKVIGKQSLQASRKEVAKKTGGEARRQPAKEVLDADNGTVDNGEPVTPQKPEQESPAPRRKMWMQESPVTAMANLLPKIRTIRTTPESPRDSGCVKRAVDRIGMLSYFQEDELVSSRSLDPLSFVEE
ncbi:uncharacterized protein LOC116250454 isoform X2 [Nymphaea colorata]|uniref:uncharacterized protein LOC116250454 isoform X2 n=1 Tax=Nymphaea colorata TaxID=210225 RepID=UPI00162F0AB7|nr:uncharacterized protein LOC116250454 isoform X2 [Nymphaea colorata]